MKTKKHPKADLNRYSGLYFSIGLTLVLFLIWRALEYKSYDTKIVQVEIAHTYNPDIYEEVPLTKILNVAPPNLPTIPAIIEVVEDVIEIEETIIQSTETDQEAEVAPPILAVDEIEVAEIIEELTVPFAVIEEVPIFQGCENEIKEQQRICFQQQIQKHIKKYLQYPPKAIERGIQGRVFVQFVIDANGEVTNIKSRGPDRLLVQEAERIIASLPQMIPGKQRKKPVKVPYTIPITFRMM